MRYLITESFTLKTPKGDVIFPIGKVIELSPDQGKRLGEKVRLVDGLENGGGLPLSAPKIPDTISAFCESYGGHCSVKVTGVYPDDCIKISCDYHKVENPSPGATITQPELMT